MGTPPVMDDTSKDTEKIPYEGDEAAPPEENDEELTGPGGRLPSVPGATPADDQRDSPER